MPQSETDTAERGPPQVARTGNASTCLSEQWILTYGIQGRRLEGLVTLVLSGRCTAYLPDHYARHWSRNDEIRPILPNKIGYESLHEMITKKGKTRGKLLDAFIDEVKAAHYNVEKRAFRIGTALS